MNNLEKFKEEVKKHEKNLEDLENSVKKAWEKHSEFLEKFPFRENPEAIDELTPTKLYEPGTPHTFLDYLEFKLKPLGAITVWSDLPWRNARENIEQFKDLVRIAVDESKTLAEKIDAPWESIPRWGSDKHFAKKLIFLYFPERTVQIFNTNHMEHFIEALRLNEEKEIISKNKFNKLYENLTVGQKYEILTEILLKTKEKTSLKDANITIFSQAFYEVFPPPDIIHPPAKITEPLSAVRMLFSPVNELGIVALFSMYHVELGFPYILKIKPGFPDAEVIDAKGYIKKVEFELFSSNFKDHKHNPEECDIIICWEDNMDENDSIRKKVKIIALKEKVGSKEE